MSPFESNLEWFEAYLSDELSESEVQEFERRMQDDKSFRAAFEDHKKFRQGIEWASLADSLEEVKRIHQTMSDSDLNVSKSKEAPIRRLSTLPSWSLAATLLLGILITTFYFQVLRSDQRSNFANFNDLEEIHPLYGTGGEEIPIFETQLNVRIITRASTSPATDSAKILLQVFQSEKETLFIDTSAMAIILTTPFEKIVSDFDDDRFYATYYHQEEPIPSVFQLASNEVAYSIPIHRQQWDQLTTK